MNLGEFENLGLPCDDSINARLHDKLIVMLHGTF